MLENMQSLTQRFHIFKREPVLKQVFVQSVQVLQELLILNLNKSYLFPTFNRIRPVDVCLCENSVRYLPVAPSFMFFIFYLKCQVFDFLFILKLLCLIKLLQLRDVRVKGMSKSVHFFEYKSLPCNGLLCDFGLVFGKILLLLVEKVF